MQSLCLRASRRPDMPDAPKESVCVIIPAYNESRHIAYVLEGIHPLEFDVVVVDDGSSDNTAELAKAGGAFVISHPRNRGKGQALLSGFNYAVEKGYELVITMDADGQHDPAAINEFIEAYRRTKIPVLIGNRMWDKSKIPPARRWTNQCMSYMLGRFARFSVPDTQCGFRLFRADVLSFVLVKSTGFAMESEILLNLAMRGFRMDSVRIPVVYSGQTSRINPLLDGYRFFKMLLSHRRNQSRLKY